MLPFQIIDKKALALFPSFNCIGCVMFIFFGSINTHFLCIVFRHRVHRVEEAKSKAMKGKKELLKQHVIGIVVIFRSY